MSCSSLVCVSVGLFGRALSFCYVVYACELRANVSGVLALKLAVISSPISIFAAVGFFRRTDRQRRRALVCSHPHCYEHVHDNGRRRRFGAGGGHVGRSSVDRLHGADRSDENGCYMTTGLCSVAPVLIRFDRRRLDGRIRSL